MTTRDRYLSASAVTAAVFLLYVVTLAPSAAMWDAGEYIAVAKSLGVPHQPGNPLYVLIAHVAGLLPLSPSYAVRINLLAALSSAITAGLWFLCAERVLRSAIERTAHRVAASATASLLGATAFTVWNQSVVMEKVYPLALVGLALTSWLVLLWLDENQARRGDTLLVLIAYTVGLGYAVHPAGLLTAPAIGIVMLRHRPRTLLRLKLMSVLVAAFLVGASPFAIIPIRAAHQPFINESAASACENGKLEAGCTFSAETARRLIGVIQREQYGGNPVMVRRASFKAQTQMFWMYFKWQWLRDFEGRMPLLQSLVAATMLVLGLFGLAAMRQRGSPASSPGTQRAAPWLWYFAPLAASFTIALIYYLNFRYGWSQSPELGDLVPREPRDRDYFYMWTFSLWGMLAGIGLASLAQGSRLKARGKPSAFSLQPRALYLVLILALVPLLANWNSASRAGQSFTREFAIDMLNSVEPNGVIITTGDNDSFPLWYAQEVEGVRRDVTVMLTPYLDTDWYARQLNRRMHVWKLTDQELDTVPPVLATNEPMQFTHGDISALIPPGYLLRNQLLVLRAIKDSFPSRSIYFSMGNYPQPLGLTPYLKRVGLVQKLEPANIRENPDTVRTQNGQHVDVPASLALWKTYGGARQVAREGKWVDASTVGMPLYYAVVGQDLAIALDARGDHAQAREIMELVKQVVNAVQ
jgi:hypothetical protein